MMAIERDKKISIITTIIVMGFTISIFYHYIQGIYLDRGFPLNTFLGDPSDKFTDFLRNYWQLTMTGKGLFLPYHDVHNYIFYLPSLLSFKNDVLAYLFYAGLFVSYFIAYNYFNLKGGKNLTYQNIDLLRDMFVFTFMTYPFLYMIERGNIDMYIFIILSLSLFFYFKNRFFISALLLGIAVHMKIYFGIFTILYLTDKKYRETGLVILLFFLLPFLTLFIDKWLFPGVQFRESILEFLSTASSSQNLYNQLYALGEWGAIQESSLYYGLKGFIYLIFPDVSTGDLTIQLLFRVYFPLSLVCAMIVVTYMLFFEKENWRRVTLATLSLILFPFVTINYRLIILFIPMWMFINTKQHSKYDCLYSILFGLLLIPKDYFIIRDWMSITNILNPMIISIFLMLIIKEGVVDWYVQNLARSKKG